MENKSDNDKLMPVTLSNLFKGERKYFSIVALLLTGIFLTALISPIIIEKEKKDWKKDLPERLVRIESESISEYKKKESRLILTGKAIHRDLAAQLKTGDISYGALIRLINQQRFRDYSLEIIAPNGKLIAWSYKTVIPAEKIFPLPYPAGEVFFYEADLTTYLTLIDTIHIENDNFYLLTAKPLDKNYELQNQYYRDVNFSKELSEKFLTDFEIGYSPFSPPNRDGRYYSFDLLNNRNNKIGVVNFQKPSPEIILKDFKEKISSIQSVLIVLACLFLFIGFRRDYIKIRFLSLKLAALIFYCAVFRGLIYAIGFPSNIFSGGLTEASYFSSMFAGGIVKSPIEFLITNIFVLIISIQTGRYINIFIKRRRIPLIRNPYLFYAVMIAAIFLSLLLLRGWAASVKSIIFDSTLRYFRETTLIQNLPSFVMNLNSFCLGLSIMILIITLLYFCIKLKTPSLTVREFMILYLISDAAVIAFILIQHEPLLTVWLAIILNSILSFLLYLWYYQKVHDAYNLVYYSLAGSLVTILLLNYFNMELERRSLKTIALEINRPDNNFYRFILTETLGSSSKDKELKVFLLGMNKNPDALAFRLWSSSPLQKEQINSSIAIYNKGLTRIGYFKAGSVTETIYSPGLINLAASQHSLLSEKKNDKTKAFSGIIAVEDDERNVIGYLSSSLEMDINNLNSADIPAFLESKQTYSNLAVDVKELKIFLFNDEKLLDVFGDIYPSKDQSNPIFKAELSPENEAMITVNLNGEDFLAYLYKSTIDNENRLTAILLKVKHISLDLFNFFKIFVIHSIFILLLLIIIFVIRIRTFQYTFRAQLLLAFLFISLLPVIILAMYNRQTVNKRVDEAVFNELNERTVFLEKYLNSNVEEGASDHLLLFGKAANDLGINFTVYEGSDKIFSSRDEYYNAGLLPQKLNPLAYFNLNYLSYREYITKERLDYYFFSSFYRKINVGEKTYTLSVNDALNNINVNISAADVDVFLFGIYSFAVFIIVLISTFIANRISRPITALTSASNRVAAGDLNTEVSNEEKGEIKILVDGFNSMVKELKQNQQEMAELERENAWKEMARQVAHEIKNPLTPMKLAVQQLIISWNEKRESFGNIFEKVSSTLINQIENLNNIASEFSRFARMPVFNLEKVELLTVINDSANLFSDENIHIEIQSQSEEINTETDRNQFRRFLINMFRNSIQAGADTITVSVNDGSSEIEMLIQDNGNGIAELYKERIFDANFTTKEKGMGIGLKLAKRFIEGLNGKIMLYESSSKGATFKIIIPSIKR